MAQLTCQELVELVTGYLEGALSPGEQAAFEDHMSRCGGCGNYIRQMRQTIALTGKLTEADLEPPARDELLHLFRAWKRESGTGDVNHNG